MLKKLFKLVLTILLICGCLFLISLIVLAWKSHSMESLGLINGQLAPCPNKPNCSCSENTENFQANIEAIVINPEIDPTPIKSLSHLIHKMGGEVVQESPDYLASHFSTNLFRFVDDLELRWDPKQSIVHLRSASRVGYSDFGANKKRIEKLKELYAESLKQN